MVGNWFNVQTGTTTRTVTGQTAGHWIYCAFRWKFVYDGSGTAAATMRVRTLNSSSGNPKDLVDIDYSSARDLAGTVVVIQPMPAGNDRFSFSFGVGNGVLGVAQLTVADLNDDGLDTFATGY